jgi:hypothetical protein
MKVKGRGKVILVKWQDIEPVFTGSNFVGKGVGTKLKKVMFLSNNQKWLNCIMQIWVE